MKLPNAMQGALLDYVPADKLEAASQAAIDVFTDLLHDHEFVKGVLSWAKLSMQVRPIADDQHPLAYMYGLMGAALMRMITFGPPSENTIPPSENTIIETKGPTDE